MFYRFSTIMVRSPTPGLPSSRSGTILANEPRIKACWINVSPGVNDDLSVLKRGEREKREDRTLLLRVENERAFVCLVFDCSQTLVSISSL